MRSWRKTLNFLKDTAKENLERDGYLPPVLLVEGDETALVGIRGFGPTASERQAMLFLLGRRLARLAPQRATLVSDAYIKVGDEVPQHSLADDPAAEECIAVVSQRRNGRVCAITVKYDRTPTLERTVIEFKAEEEMRDAEPYLLLAFWRGAGVWL
jgi:hypothetical protein